MYYAVHVMAQLSCFGKSFKTESHFFTFHKEPFYFLIPNMANFVVLRHPGHSSYLLCILTSQRVYQMLFAGQNHFFGIEVSFSVLNCSPKRDLNHHRSKDSYFNLLFINPPSHHGWFASHLCYLFMQTK